MHICPSRTENNTEHCKLSTDKKYFTCIELYSDEQDTVGDFNLFIFMTVSHPVQAYEIISLMSQDDS